MKSESQVKHKLQQAVFRHLKKRLADRLDEGTACNCAFYREIELPDGPVGVCIFPWEKPEPERGCGDERASSCLKFTPNQTKEDLKTEFLNFVSEAPLADVAREGYAEIAALRWVLDAETSTGTLEEPVEEVVSDPIKPTFLEYVRKFLTNEN